MGQTPVHLFDPVNDYTIAELNKRYLLLCLVSSMILILKKVVRIFFIEADPYMGRVKKVSELMKLFCFIFLTTTIDWDVRDGR